MNGPWQPVQEAQALASELRCHIMSLGQNVVASKDVRVFFKKCTRRSDEYFGVFISMQIRINSRRFWEERWTLTMKAVRRNVNKLQDWQAWLLQLWQFHKGSNCPVRFHVALRVTFSCDLQKAVLVQGSRIVHPVLQSLPSRDWICN